MVDLAQTEVRHCSRCGHATAVCRKAWVATAFGVETGGFARRDFVCQDCGTAFSLTVARARLKPAIVVGFPLLFLGSVFALLAGSAAGTDATARIVAPIAALAALAGVGVLWWAWQPARTYRQHPVVPDAPLPDLRYDVPPPPRHRCTCGQPADCIGETAHEQDGASQGTDRRYLCPSCGAEFELSDPWGMVTLAGASVVFVAIGLGLASTAAGQGMGAWACSAAVGLFGALGLVGFVVQLLDRLRHPQIPADVRA